MSFTQQPFSLTLRWQAAPLDQLVGMRMAAPRPGIRRYHQAQNRSRRSELDEIQRLDKGTYERSRAHERHCVSSSQGLFTAALAVDLTLTGLTGYELAPTKSLATLPFAMITVSGARPCSPPA
jgi:hypothetical protein